MEAGITTKVNNFTPGRRAGDHAGCQFGFGLAGVAEAISLGSPVGTGLHQTRAV